NASPAHEKYFAKIDLSKMSFNGFMLDGFRFSTMAEAANFDNCSLKKSLLDSCVMPKATFRKAVLDESRVLHITGNNIDFSDASLTDITFLDCTFKKAKFTNCNLQRSFFNKVDLCGADFTDADMTGVGMKDVKVDDKTKFPPSFTKFDGITWKGTGKNPY